MIIENLTPRQLNDSELLNLHRELFIKYIKTKTQSLLKKKLLIKLYDLKIGVDNIRIFYNQKINVFTNALVTDNLKSIIKHNSY